MARKGLLYESGSFFAKFQKNKPSLTRFRIDDAPNTKLKFGKERKDYYKACGWQFVKRFGGNFEGYKAEDATVTELHTDRFVQMQHLRWRGWGWEWVKFAIALLILLFCFVYSFKDFWIPKEVRTGYLVVEWLLLCNKVIVFLCGYYTIIVQTILRFSTIRRENQGEIPPH